MKSVDRSDLGQEMIQAIEMILKVVNPDLLDELV